MSLSAVSGFKINQIFSGAYGADLSTAKAAGRNRYEVDLSWQNVATTPHLLRLELYDTRAQMDVVTDTFTPTWRLVQSYDLESGTTRGFYNIPWKGDEYTGLDSKSAWVFFAKITPFTRDTCGGTVTYGTPTGGFFALNPSHQAVATGSAFAAVASGSSYSGTVLELPEYGPFHEAVVSQTRYEFRVITRNTGLWSYTFALPAVTGPFWTDAVVTYPGATTTTLTVLVDDVSGNILQAKIKGFVPARQGFNGYRTFLPSVGYSFIITDIPNLRGGPYAVAEETPFGLAANRGTGFVSTAGSVTAYVYPVSGSSINAQAQLIQINIADASLSYAHDYIRLPAGQVGGVTVTTTSIYPSLAASVLTACVTLGTAGNTHYIDVEIPVPQVVSAPPLVMAFANHGDSGAPQNQDSYMHAYYHVRTTNAVGGLQFADVRLFKPLNSGTLNQEVALQGSVLQARLSAETTHEAGDYIHGGRMRVDVFGANYAQPGTMFYGQEAQLAAPVTRANLLYTAYIDVPSTVTSAGGGGMFPWLNNNYWYLTDLQVNVGTRAVTHRHGTVEIKPNDTINFAVLFHNGSAGVNPVATDLRLAVRSSANTSAYHFWSAATVTTASVSGDTYYTITVTASDEDLLAAQAAGLLAGSNAAQSLLAEVQWTTTRGTFSSDTFTISVPNEVVREPDV